MKRNDRLSLALHVLLHMVERGEAPMTSADMAACAQTHPVVIRRTFAGLREAGIVRSDKGHGGGWRLGRSAHAISLLDVQHALGERIVALAQRQESPGCLVERAVTAAVDEALLEAEQAIERRLATLSLADLARDVQALYAALPSSRRKSTHAS